MAKITSTTKCSNPISLDLGPSAANSPDSLIRHEVGTVHLLHQLFWALLLCEGALVALYLINGLIGNPLEVIGALIDLDREAAIGAWLSSTQLFAIGAVFIGMRLLAGKGDIGRLYLLMGCGFTYLSMDEAAAIHEKITGVLKRFPWAPRVAENRGLWIPVYVLIVVVFLIYFKKPIGAVCHRFPKHVIIFASGAVLMVFGGVFLEILGYYHFFDAVPKIGIALEEFAEMAGETMMLLGVASCYIEARNPS